MTTLFLLLPNTHNEGKYTILLDLQGLGEHLP